MQNNRLSIVVLGLIISASLPALADTERARPAEVVAKVHAAVALLASEGARALNVVGDPSSGFTWKDTYIFVVNCEADRVLANPAFPERVGGDIKQHEDYAGKRYGIELCETAARPGGGWVEYVWLPPKGETAMRKISFVMSVPGAPYQAGAGIYDESIGLDELSALTED